MKLQTRRLRRAVVSRAILLTAAAAAGLISTSTMAAVVTSPVANLVLPATNAGLYINVITGLTGTGGAGVAGWDLNPYNTPSGLGIYWIPTQAGAPVQNGGVAQTVTGPLLVLAPGAIVQPSSVYTAAIQAASSFRVTQDAFLGFRFWNETTSAINYGYARIQTTAGTGYPATIVSIAYENTGLPITIPGGAVPPQFAYTPAAGSTVTATGGGAVGSTSNLSIAAAIGTAGSGTGVGATTTLTCTAPTAPFAGFAQTVTATGTGAISGGPLAGTCTRGAAVATQTLTCNENRGGTATPVTWTLSCPAGVAAPVATAIPTLGLPGLWVTMLVLLGFGLYALRINRQ